MNPSDNPIQPDPQSVPPANPPVFHNPLAQAYGDHTGQLPPPAVSTPQPPAINPKPFTPPPPPPAGPAPVPPAPAPAQPTVNQLPQSVVKPAPVRLAPEPKADDYHAAAATQSAHATPFGTPVSQVNTSTMPTPVPAKKSRKGLVVGLIIGLSLMVIGVGAFFLLRPAKKPTTPSPTSSVVASSKRDTQEKSVQPFSQKVMTECYVTQVLVPVDTQLNKDCTLDVRYGEQKVSSITVSPQRDFNLVADQSSGQASDGTTRFDTEKYLDALIANAISKDLIVTREKLTVGGLEATKVVGKQQASSASIVAYVFIVLPEGDRKFNEKTFVAFIITGAYNDDYSRKGFDQALSTWSWK